MNLKKTITMIAAASTVAVSGVTFAQYITSTPGAGGTATCNMIRGGNGGHRADPNACGQQQVAPVATIERIEEPVAVVTPEPAPMVAEVTEMGAPPAPEAPAPEPLPARADRG